MHVTRVSRLGPLAAAVILALLTISPGSLLAQTSGNNNFWEPAGKNWPVPGGDWGHTRSSTLTQINPTNVTNLQGAWMTRLNGSGLDPKTTQEGTPIVRDGIMYLPTGQMDIFALNAKTGTILWQYVSDVDPKYPGRWANRGVDIAEGKVFATQKDGSIIALDQKTGTKIWQTYLNDEDRPRTLLSNAPLYYDGLIYSGLSGAGQATRGRFIALDAKTGQIAWKFNTIPGPDEPNFGTWEGESWRWGGANVWNTATVDPALGMVYFQTGNAFPDYGGASRGGENLYSSAIMALDAKTGAYKWHFQSSHHDMWDYDIGNTPILYDTVINGQPRKALAIATKQGFLFLLDRITGQGLIPIEERPVPQEPRAKSWPTQPYPVGGDAFVPQCTDSKWQAFGFITGCLYAPYWNIPVIGGPGGGGGADWAPVSYNPNLNLIFVTANVSLSPLVENVKHLDLATGKIVNDPEMTFGGNSAPVGSSITGMLTAMDSRTDKIVWQKDMPYNIGIGSGSMTTASGLLFHGEPDGNIVAYDAANGNELWKFQTGMPAEAPVMTYEVDGEQYVAIATGGSTQAIARGDGLWAFKLNGGLQAWPTGPKPPKAVVDGPSGEPVDSDTVGIGSPANGEYAYTPSKVHVKAGTAATWTNNGSLEHTVTFQGTAGMDSGLLSTGQSAAFQFDTPGTYNYFCTPHPWMLGQVIVD
jgi:PQQ-dependent dehydrogenase (methanol/ethanol family)